jgi:hypothetical protein
MWRAQFTNHVKGVDFIETVRDINRLIFDAEEAGGGHPQGELDLLMPLLADGKHEEFTAGVTELAEKTKARREADGPRNIADLDVARARRPRP